MEKMLKASKYCGLNLLQLEPKNVRRIWARESAAEGQRQGQTFLGILCDG